MVLQGLHQWKNNDNALSDTITSIINDDKEEHFHFHDEGRKWKAENIDENVESRAKSCEVLNPNEFCMLSTTKTWNENRESGAKLCGVLIPYEFCMLSALETRMRG